MKRRAFGFLRASEKETGGCPETARPSGNNAMLNILKSDPGGKVQDLYSSAHVPESRRLKAWLDDRLKRGETEVFSEVITLTPTLAEMLLKRNPANRNLRQRAVATYATDINGGNWALNGESIKISRDGLMNDGQHRCHAVIEAGRSIKTVVLFGVERESRMTVDQGAVRTAGNFLSMAGHENANVVASACSFIWQFENGGDVTCNNRVLPSKMQVAQTYRDHPGIDASIKAIPRGGRAAGSKSLLAFCHYVLSRRSGAHTATAFILQLCLGDGLPMKSPIYWARETLRDDGKTMRPATKAELIFRTWNAWRNGKAAKQRVHLQGELPVLER